MSVSAVASVSAVERSERAAVVEGVVEELESRRIDSGDIEVSMGIDCIGEASCRFAGGTAALGQRYVALLMRRTIKGRICFPSAWV